MTFLLAILLLPACAAMMLGGNSSSESAPATARTATQSSADSAVSGSIRQQYVADSEISQYSLGIRTVSGRVTLTGAVGSYDIRDRVIDIAQNTAGVVSVDSRVTVNTNLGQD